MDILVNRAPMVLLATSTGLLVTVFAMEHLGGLAPCSLCILQRWPYAAVIMLSGFALLPVSGTVRRVLLALAALALIIGGTIAFYHTGVEQHWFAGPSACSGTIHADTLQALRQQLMAAPVVRCDEIPWSLFGNSLAAYNLLASIVLTALAVAAALRRASSP